MRGVAVFERLSRDMELHMMHVIPTGRSALRSVGERDGATVVELQGDIRFAGAEIFASRACEDLRLTRSSSTSPRYASSTMPRGV